MNKCQPVALGVAIGVLWAAYVFLAGIVAMFGWGTALVETSHRSISAMAHPSSARSSARYGLSSMASSPASSSPGYTTWSRKTNAANVASRSPEASRRQCRY